jgi:4-amino-4-deoxy-L-arabinose transferase-like glycosyltransferase
VSSKTSNSSKLRTTILVSAILLLAFGFRVLYLNERGIWYDEAFAILFASRSFEEMLYGTLTSVGGAAADVHPLFYYFSLHVWLGQVGDSVFSARYYSVLYGVGTIPFVYRLARELSGERVAIISAAVISLAPFHLAYSQEARMYAQLGFWSSAAFFAFTRYQRIASKKWWALFVFAGAGALYSHNLAFVALGALGIWGVIDALRTRTWRVLIATTLAGLAMIALWLPWLFNVPGQFGKIEQAYWVPQPTVVTLIQTLLVFAFDFENAAYPQSLLAILIFVALMLSVFIALGILRRRTKHNVLYAGTMAVLPIIFLFGLSLVRPVYIIRALMPAFLWYIILIGWMLAELPRLLSRAVIILLGAILFMILPAYYTYAEFPRSPFEDAARGLDRRVQSNDVVVHDNKLSYFPMYYYDRGLAQTFVADPSGAGSDTLALPTQRALQLYASALPDATANKSRIWFIIFRQALDQAEQDGHPHPNKAWMDTHFTQVSLMQYNDLNVYLYQE